MIIDKKITATTKGGCSYVEPTFSKGRPPASGDAELSLAIFLPVFNILNMKLAVLNCG
jgi:hypothetical protein